MIAPLSVHVNTKNSNYKLYLNIPCRLANPQAKFYIDQFKIQQMFSVPNKKSKAPRERSKDKQFSSFVSHNNSVGVALQPLALSSNTSQDMNLAQAIPINSGGNQAQNRRNQQVINNNTAGSQSQSIKSQARQLKNTNGSGKVQRTLNSAKETQIVSQNNSKISTPGQHLISASGIQNQKAKSSVLDQIVQMQSVQLQTQNNNLNTASLSQQINHQQISQRRGTTPVRPAAKNQLTQMQNASNSIHGSGGLPVNQIMSANNGSHKINSRGKQQFAQQIQQSKKQKLANDQQINRLMAAANAHAQANPNIQKQLKNQHLFPPNNQGQMPSNQMLLATLQGTDGIDGKQYSTGIQTNKSISEHMNDMKRQGADSAQYQYHTTDQQKHMYNNMMVSEENLQMSQQNQGHFDPLNIAPQRSHDLNEMYIQDGNELQLFDPVPDHDPTPDHMAARASSEYVNTDEEEDDDAVDELSPEKQQDLYDGQNQYIQNNMHPLKQLQKNSKNQKMKSDDRKTMGRQQVMQNDLEVAQANQILLQNQYNLVAEKDFNGSGSQSRKKSRSQNKRGENQTFSIQGFQNNSITGNNYNANGKLGQNNRSGARNRGQSVSHAQNQNLPSTNGASRQGKQSASIDRKLEIKHQKSQQQTKNLKNNLSQPMNNVAKIAQETKSLKTIQYNPIGLNMAAGINQVQNQITSPQPVPSQNMIFKQQQQLAAEGMANALMQDEAQQQVLQHLGKIEQIQVQLSRRVDIFEEEIIKRVREIQKYSKGLNQVMRKQVIPKQEDQDKKMQSMEEKIVATENSQRKQDDSSQQEQKATEFNEQAIIEVQSQMEKLFQMFEQQNLDIQQVQESVDPAISENMQELLNQNQQLSQQQQEYTQQINEQVNIIQQIQEKLGEQTQLVSIFDDQITNQEEKLEAMIKSQTEMNDQIMEMQQNMVNQGNQQSQPNSQSPKKEEPSSPLVNDVTQQVFDNIMNSEQMQKIQNHEDFLQQVEEKFKEFDMNILKLSEDGEGRDGLILQQNQDITNLFQANEQILGNEKNVKEHYEKLENQLQELINQINEADWQNGSQVEQRVQQVVLQQQPQKSQLSARSDTSNKQIDQLRQNLETRIMLSIETLKREISVTMAQNSSQINQSLEALQKTLESHDTVVQKVPQNENELAILQEQLQNLELQMQAQFDEWATEQDKSLQDKFNQINQVLIEQQDNDYVSKNVMSQVQHNLEQQIAESQSNIDKVILMQQTNVNPLHAKIEDLQIEISQKVIEQSSQQDQQIAQLVEEIKQISDNLENMQEIVVQNTNEAEAFKEEISNQVQILSQTKNEPQQSTQYDTHIQTLNNQLMDLSVQVKQAKSQQNDMAELQSDITEIKIDIQKLRSTIQQQSQDQQQQQNSAQMQPVAPIIDEKTLKDVMDLKKHLKDIQLELNNQEEQMKQILSQISQKDARIKTLNQQVQEIDQTIAQTNKGMYTFQTKIDGIKDEVDVRFDELVSEIKSKQMHLDKIQKALKEIEGNDYQQNQTDLLTMKNIVSYLQDSNYQAQIDSLKNDISKINEQQIQPRFSLPEQMKYSQAGPISSRDSLPAVQEIETVVMKKGPRKVQEVKSSNPMARKKNNQDSKEKSPQAKSKNQQDLHLDLGSANLQDKQDKKDVIDINENVQAKRLELSPIIKDPVVASSRDGRDTERDNLLLQQIGLQSAKKSDKEAIERQIEQQNNLEAMDPSSNVIKKLEERFEVNLDDMDDIVPDAQDFMNVKGRPSGNNPMERPTNQEERPSDISLPDFIHDKEEVHEEEQFSDDFDTMEKPKEIDLIIQDRTNKYVEYSASALNLSGIKLNEMNVDQLTDEVMKLINFDQLIDSELYDLNDVIRRQ